MAPPANHAEDRPIAMSASLMLGLRAPLTPTVVDLDILQIIERCVTIGYGHQSSGDHNPEEHPYGEHSEQDRTDHRGYPHRSVTEERTSREAQREDEDDCRRPQKA
jgi:hypothetical protein